MTTMKDDDIRKVYEPLARDHDRLRAELMERLDEQAAPIQSQPRVSHIRSARRFAWAAVAAGILLALTLLGVFGNGNHNIAWADVVESFKSVTFFHATLYTQDTALDQPTKTDLWMGHGGKLRVCSGTQVGFGGSGQAIKCYEVKRRTECEPRGIASAILDERVFGFQKELSLDAVVRIFGKNASLSPPIVNEEASISEDMTVFDVTTNRTPEVIRIWTLSTSKLPVRIRTWDPRTGRSTDAFLSYAEPQPPGFFSADEFEKALQDQSKSPVDLIHALMEDPADRPLTKEEAFSAAGGYHMPVIEQVGITDDGAVWVIATKSRNRGPKGHSFNGFQALEDNLGRSYQRGYGRWNLAEDTSYQVFLPLEYPFDERVPNTLTLTCKPVQYPGMKAPEVIGRREVTEWQQGGEWPDGFAKCSPRISQARYLLGKRNWETLNRVLETIPGEPESSDDALRREQVRLSMLVKRHAYDEAASLGEKLQLLSEKDYEQWHGSANSPREFNDYIIALACLGRLDDAQKLFDRTKELDPDIPTHLHKNAKRHIRQANKTYFEENIETLVRDLSGTAHLTVDEIDAILGTDIRNDERFEGYRLWDWKPE